AKRRAPRCASSTASVRTTLGGARPSAVAAAVRLPRSTMATKVRMAVRVSIEGSQFIRKADESSSIRPIVRPAPGAHSDPRDGPEGPPRGLAPMDERTFHAGEQAVQQRIGVRDELAARGDKFVRPYLPEQHREFYGNQPFLVVAGRDG